MRASLRALLNHAIDYAGTYPPARLALPEALANYLRYRSGAEAWIVGRFVCPALKLGELARLLEHSYCADCPLTVIGTGAQDLDSFRRSLDEDADRMSAFQSRWASCAPLTAFEVRLPEGDPIEALHSLKAFRNIELFAEIAWDRRGEQLEAIAEAGGIGAKARTGGVEPTAFPSSESLAAFLREALDLDLPFKLTAGLHEPIRHDDAVLGARHHGFLNVFVAAALHVANDLSTAEIASILEGEDPAAVRIGEDSVSWGGWEAPYQAIEDARELLIGFGSCSVEEPLHGLARLGFLAEAPV